MVSTDFAMVSVYILVLMFLKCNYILKGRTHERYVKAPSRIAAVCCPVPMPRPACVVRRMSYACHALAVITSVCLTQPTHGLHTPVKHSERPGLLPGQNITPPSGMHLDVRHCTFRPQFLGRYDKLCPQLRIRPIPSLSEFTNRLLAIISIYRTAPVHYDS